MFHFGFSYVGLLYLAMLLVPEILRAGRMPADHRSCAEKESVLLQLLEKLGGVLVCVCVLIFSDFNIRDTWWILWLILSLAAMVLYDLYWVRYLKSNRTGQDLYRPFLKIRTPGAVLPVAAFGLLALYGGNAFLLFADILFGIGRIGIHRQHEKEVLAMRRPKKAVRILKGIGKGLGWVLLAACFAIMAGRNIKYFEHFRLIQNGIDEEGYVTLGGQQQYVTARGMNRKNPVIIFLHGGPGAGGTWLNNTFSDPLTSEYTFVGWDQRGCGRTYERNSSVDPDNDTVTFDQLQKDLDGLVDYARERFGQDKVIIMGHSWGTVVGSVYAQEHPEKVEAYIGVGQVISAVNGDLLSYEDAKAAAVATGEDTSEMDEAARQFEETPDVGKLLALRTHTLRYHPYDTAVNLIRFGWNYVTAPYFNSEDLRQLISSSLDQEKTLNLGRQLTDYLMGFDLMKRPFSYEVPMYYISGSDDWICPVEPVRIYADSITAPESEFRLMERTGHVCLFTQPEEFGGIVRELLAGRSH